jgi:cytochrome c553
MTARLIGIPKPTTFRSEKLRRAVASLPCQACGREGMTQAAHSNQGKGMATKASDARLAALCVTCHTELDQGKTMSKLDRRLFEDEMMLKTYIALMENGLLEVAK